MPLLIPATPLLLATQDLENAVAEVRGSGSNKEIARALELVGMAGSPDETHWCSAILAKWMEDAGYPSPRSPRARSWIGYGERVHSWREARPGDIVCGWRGARDDGITGHAGLLADTWWNPLRADVIGGNQRELLNDRVCIKPFLTDQVLWIGRPVR